MKANHNDLCTGAPRLRRTASVAPAVLAWLVATLLLLGGAPPGHAQADSEPALGTVDDLTLLRNQAVDIDRTTTADDPVVLPAATGGDGTLTYTLACAASETSCDATSKLPLGLAFDAADRELSGTPTAAGTWDMVYTVTDADTTDPVLTPFVEAAGRRDGGDGLSGAGLELAGGVRYRAPSLELEARGRWLAAHTEAGARERGVSVTARAGPGAHGRGLSLLVSPRWGAETGGAQALWQEEMPGLSAGTGGEAASLDARVGYGLALTPRGPLTPRGLLTPFAETGLGGGDRQRLRLGTRFDASGMDLGVEFAGERVENGGAAPEHALTLDVIFRF